MCMNFVSIGMNPVPSFLIFTQEGQSHDSLLDAGYPPPQAVNGEKKVIVRFTEQVDSVYTTLRDIPLEEIDAITPADFSLSWVYLRNGKALHCVSAI